MPQETLEADPLAAPAGGGGARGPYRTAPGSARRAAQEGARAGVAAPQGDALTLPGAAVEQTQDRGTEAPVSHRGDGDHPAVATPPEPPHRPQESAPQDTPQQGAALPATPPAAGERARALVVIEGGVVKYADTDVYVADLGVLVSPDADPDALFQTLKDLRAVRPSEARTHLVDRVHGGLRNSLAL